MCPTLFLPNHKDVQEFIEAHLFTWIDGLHAAIAAEALDGYCNHLVRVGIALLHAIHEERSA